MLPTSVRIISQAYQDPHLSVVLRSFRSIRILRFTRRRTHHGKFRRGTRRLAFLRHPMHESMFSSDEHLEGQRYDCLAEQRRNVGRPVHHPAIAMEVEGKYFYEPLYDLRTPRFHASATGHDVGQVRG